MMMKRKKMVKVTCLLLYLILGALTLWKGWLIPFCVLSFIFAIGFFVADMASTLRFQQEEEEQEEKEQEEEEQVVVLKTKKWPYVLSILAGIVVLGIGVCIFKWPVIPVIIAAIVFICLNILLSILLNIVKRHRKKNSNKRIVTNEYGSILTPDDVLYLYEERMKR